MLLAITDKEGGRPGMTVANSNGTYDIGPMQFNFAYLMELRQCGFAQPMSRLKVAIRMDRGYPSRLAVEATIVVRHWKFVGQRGQLPVANSRI